MFRIQWIFIMMGLLLSTHSFAQVAEDSNKVTRHIELGVSTQSYKGDLSHQYDQWSNGIHVGILWSKKKLINTHLNLMFGNAVAQNPDYFFDNGADIQASPVDYVKAKMIAGNFDLRLNLINKNNFKLYLYQGLGIVRFDLRDENNDKLSDKLTSRAPDENFSNITVFLPNGLGASYTFKPGYGVGFQVGWMNTSTDYLDNMSKWGDRDKNDNVLIYKMSFYIPFKPKEKQLTPLPKLN